MKRVMFTLGGLLVAASAYAAESITVLDVMPGRQMNNPLYEAFMQGLVIAGRHLGWL